MSRRIKTTYEPMPETLDLLEAARGQRGKTDFLEDLLWTHPDLVAVAERINLTRPGAAVEPAGHPSLRQRKLF